MWFVKVVNVTWKKWQSKSIKKLKKVLTLSLKFVILITQLEKSNNVLWKLSKTSITFDSQEKRKINFLLRVWSWLRMNAGGMPKTCKSNEVVQWRWSACTKSDLGCHLVAKGWVTRRLSTFKTGITIRNDC